MSLFRRRLMTAAAQKRGGGNMLPSGYIQLDYIESTETQYINTNIDPLHDWDNSSTSMEIEISFTKFNYYRQLYGANMFWVGTDRDGFFESTSNWKASRPSDIKCILNRTYKLKLERYKNISYKFFIDDKLNCESGSAINTEDKLCIGCIEYRTIKRYFCNSLIYNFKYFIEGVMVKNFIPCISPSKEVGMYDIIDGIFYGSATGTPFIAGNHI